LHLLPGYQIAFFCSLEHISSHLVKHGSSTSPKERVHHFHRTNEMDQGGKMLDE
jgi:hypothetical protein